jgi:cellulose synthase (UDP-forming)
MTPCCGTNVLFRLEAIQKIGGFQYGSITEDFLTSMILHHQGYQSLYCPINLAIGLSPYTLSDFFKQRFRWSFGSCQLIRPLVNIWKDLNFNQRFIYGSAFFNLHLSLPLSILILFPLFHLFFPTIFHNLSNLREIYYELYFGSFFITFLLILGIMYIEIPFIYMIKNIQETICLLICNLLVLLYYYGGISYSFKITPKDKKFDLLQDFIWLFPYFLYLGLVIYGFCIQESFDVLNTVWLGIVLFQMLPIFTYPFCF